MESEGISIARAAVLAIVSLSLLVTGTQTIAQQEIVLHNFDNNGKDGFGPVSGLVFDTAGNLYGTTEYGGTGSCTGVYPGCGTVFELSPKSGGGWDEKILHNFVNDGTDGTSPRAALTLDAHGNLYGTTYYGGSGIAANCISSGGCGTVFELSPVAGGGWTEKVLHSFDQDGDGILPAAGMIFDATGNLYGTTTSGGSAYYYGTVFELTPAKGGVWGETLLHSFNSNGRDASNPSSGLVFDATGNLYGTTSSGIGVVGSVFELSPAASGGWTERRLYEFENSRDGATPLGPLSFDAAGNLYGTTLAGGNNSSSAGVAFELAPQPNGSWTETILHNFAGAKDGHSPQAGVIIDAAGSLYGTTVVGGQSVLCSPACGTVFKLTPGPGGTWTEKRLNSFGRGKDGQYPYAGVILDAAGNLYGTTSEGGAYGYGTVFEITP